MKDKELLEKAAKAAGYTIHIWGAKGSENAARLDTTAPTRWNPLTDDGDALRLAVKLGMIVVIQDSGCVSAEIPGIELAYEYECSEEATRRAIVRAAAAMAKE